MFNVWRQRIARLIAPALPRRTNTRMYAMGKPSRLTSGWGTSTSSEDAELSSSLRTARNRSRELVRDAAYAKRAKVVVQNNVIGTGIGMQAKVVTSRDVLNDRINDEIEAVWDRWCDHASCHTGASLHFADFERQLLGQVFEAGEIFVRLYDRRMGNSRVPLCMELIEPERIADEVRTAPGADNRRVRLGVEVDDFGAPVAYLIRTNHPSDLRMTAEQTSKIERVPAEQILHIRVIDRWPQTRSMPWMHASGRKFNDMDGLTEAEITAARGAACYMGFIETPDSDTPYGEPQADGSVQSELEPAMIERLNAGEKFNFAAPNRPNSQLEPFMRMMLREVAAGTGISYESLSRDYSQSNYSSSRLALLDDRDLWRTLQMWFIRNFRQILHRRWLRQAVLSRAITSIPLEEYAAHPEKFEAVRFKPRGWSWIDPTKEVEAYKEGIKAGFTTVSKVIDLTADGHDLEDVLKERRQELDMMRAEGLLFSTDPSTVEIPAQTPAPKADEGDMGDPAEDPAVSTAEKMLKHIGGPHV